MLNPWQCDVYSLGLSMLNILFPDLESRKEWLNELENNE